MNILKTLVATVIDVFFCCFGHVLVQWLLLSIIIRFIIYFLLLLHACEIFILGIAIYVYYIFPTQ